jgi:hypothetical protein
MNPVSFTAASTLAGVKGVSNGHFGSSPHERMIAAQIAMSIKGAHASPYQVDNRSNLVVSGMPQPALGRIYEVWLNRGGASPQPTDALFSVTNRGSGSVAVPEDLCGVKEAMVASEPSEAASPR